MSSPWTLLFSKLGRPLLRVFFVLGLVADNHILVCCTHPPPVPAQRGDPRVLERGAPVSGVGARRLLTSRDCSDGYVRWSWRCSAHRFGTGGRCKSPPRQPRLGGSSSDTGGAGFRTIDCPLRLRVDDAFSCPRQEDEGWVDGWLSSAVLRGQQACHLGFPPALRPRAASEVCKQVASPLPRKSSWL